jgi:hypothetical protein
MILEQLSVVSNQLSVGLSANDQDVSVRHGDVVELNPAVHQVCSAGEAEHSARHPPQDQQ